MDLNTGPAEIFIVHDEILLFYVRFEAEACPSGVIDFQSPDPTCCFPFLALASAFHQSCPLCLMMVSLVFVLLPPLMWLQSCYGLQRAALERASLGLQWGVVAEVVVVHQNHFFHSRHPLWPISFGKLSAKVDITIGSTAMVIFSAPKIFPHYY